MIVVDIPGRERPLTLRHVVLDYNGTIAVDGALLPDAAERIARLLPSVQVHLLTADTYGTARAQCEALGVEVCTFPREGAGACKESFVKGLEGGVACFGNGFNDIPMFDVAELAVAVLEGEGACAALLSHATVAVRSIAEGLDLLLKPQRLRATLRN
ncbi:MAG: HAD family hydrolase [Pyramidobacter sp.]